ncbi:NlpC/P60 family protein [Corynebacterium sp. LK2510]|uniref:C40 family peptidase n=1 Tax=Corynebacterium sp. LK2510 TaxID=3110472 RepID=UPI0034CFB568
MGKHSLASRGRSFRTPVTALACGAIIVSGVQPLAVADEVDTLIAEMDTLSHEATGKAEELKQTEDEIAVAELRLEELRVRVGAAKREVEEINIARGLERDTVNSIAASQNRTTRSDLVINSLGAENPQKLIDRAAYLDSIIRKSERALSDLQRVNEQAAEKANEANIAVAETEFQRNQLDAKRSKLERERGELDQKVAEIVARVDGLTPEQRARWENKDNPIAAPAVVLSGAGAGIVGAAMAQLGKPYGWGASGPDAFDCSGLMVWAYAQNGTAIPRTSQAQLAGGTPVSLSELQPGDIIGYYPGVTHVGMYIGNGQVVHASDYGVPVQVVGLNSMPIQGAVRY